MTQLDFQLTNVQVVLLGFMGAGKSTVGPLLAELLSWRFLDTDQVLERREGCTIAELFSRHGEENFRRLEESTVAELMILDHTVIALGGGAIESAQTRSLLASRPRLCTVFLDGPLEIMLQRCDQSQTVRPLLQDREQVESRYMKRLQHYRLAKMTVDTEGLTPPMIADKIARFLGARTAKLEATQYSKDRSQ